MKLRTVIFCATLGFHLLSWSERALSQDGIYSYCGSRHSHSNSDVIDPFDRSNQSTMGQVLGAENPQVEVSFYSAEHWTTREKAAVDFAEVLKHTEIALSRTPLWNLDTPITLHGNLQFHGKKHRFAVARWRVCFQDDAGTPWYFQWDPALPKEWLRRTPSPVNR